MAEELIYRISFQGLDEQTKAIGQLDAEISALNATVKAQREEAKFLERTNQQGTARYQELQQAIGETVVTSRELTKQKSDLIRETQNEAKVNQKAEGSIDALRAQLSILTKEYNSLGKQQRETAKGKEVQTQARAISDELKALEGVIGDNRRNVGNYKSALIGLETEMRSVITAQLQLAASGQKDSKAYKDLDNQLKGLSQQYKETASQVSEADDKFKSLTSTTDNASGSVDSLKKQLRQIKEAAAVAGEGTEEFQRLTAEAAVLQDKIDDVNDALRQEKGTEFEKFREQLGGVGQSLGNLDFKQANERIANLGKTLKGLTFSSLTNGVKAATGSFSAFGRVLLANPIFLIATIIAAVGIALFALKDKVKVIGQAFDALTFPIRAVVEGFKSIGDAIGLTSFAADEAARKVEESTIAEIANLQQYQKELLSQKNAEIALRKAKGEETVELERERLKFIEDVTKQELDLQQNRLNALLQSFDKSGKVSEEQKQQYDDLNKIVDDLRLSYREAGDEIKIFNAALESDAAKKEAEELRKLQDEREKANEKRISDNEKLIRQIEDANIDLIQDELTRELEQASLNNKRRKEEIESTVADAKLKNEALLVQEKIYAKQLSEITSASLEKEKQARESRTAQFLAQTKETSDKLIQIETDRLEELEAARDKANRELLASNELSILRAQSDAAELEALKEKLRTERDIELQNVDLTESEIALIKERYRQEEADLDRQFREQQIASTVEGLGKLSETVNSLISINNSLTDIELANLDERYAAQLANVEKGSEAEKKILEKKVAEENKIKKQQFENNKRLQIAQTLIQTATNAVAAFGSLIGIPIVGQVLGGIAAAAALAAGLAQVAVIQKTQFTPTKLAKGGQIPFDTGGVIQGNSHANGGVPFVAGGQMMEAEGGELVVNKNIWSRPDFVNSISAMNAATGGVRFAEGGVIPTRFTPSGQSITTAALTKSSEDVSALIPILSNIQVTNNVVDTTSNQSTLINITNNSTLQ